MQYSSFNKQGLKYYAQDFLTDHIIKNFKFKYFSLGVSNDAKGKLNINLLNKKLKYGANLICNDIYEINF